MIRRSVVSLCAASSSRAGYASSSSSSSGADMASRRKPVEEVPSCCFRVLGIKHPKDRKVNEDEELTAEEVKKAYRQKTKRMHPDVGGDELKYRQLRTAYEEALSRIGGGTGSCGATSFYDAAKQQQNGSTSGNGEWTPPKDFYDHPHSYGHARQPAGAQRSSASWTTRDRDKSKNKEGDRQQGFDYDPKESQFGDATRRAHGQYYREEKPFPSGFTAEERAEAKFKSQLSLGWWLTKRVLIFGTFFYICCTFDNKRIREAESARESGYADTPWGRRLPPESDPATKASYWVPGTNNTVNNPYADAKNEERGKEKLPIRDDAGVIPKGTYGRSLPMTSTVASVGGYPHTPEGLAAKRAAKKAERDRKAGLIPTPNSTPHQCSDEEDDDRCAL